MTAGPVFGADEVTVQFGEVTAVDGVSVTAEPGAVTAVVGGDGAGKTTLLRAVVGRVMPTRGRITAPPPAQVGYQPASGGSWADLTVSQNMQFVGTTYGLRGRALADRTGTLLARAGLAGARDRLARDLSGGMRTKLGFCLSILHEPTLLVLDEPSTGVDPVSRVELWRLMSEAAAAGTAVLIATTYLDEAERCSSVLLLDHGRPLLTGAPSEVIARSPGVVVRTPQASRPEFAWRHADGFREWWPAGAGNGRQPVEVDLEDVAIVAALRSRTGGTP
jgi:ABC-2 type transport system ATP-binding protein